jgi:L-histidine Nalpha-methyltransferase / hercynylcysteine S-oxide synthase
MERTSESFADTSPDSKNSTSNSDSPSGDTETAASSPPLSAVDDDSAIKSETVSPPLHILFLGSSLGNFSRPDMASFLLQLPLRPGSGDTLLLGLDGDNGKELVERAYDDFKGVTRTFIMNGLRGESSVVMSPRSPS